MLPLHGRNDGRKNRPGDRDFDIGRLPNSDLPQRPRGARFQAVVVPKSPKIAERLPAALRKLSQVVWEQGLPGIVRDVHGFGAISSVTVTVTNSVTDEAASAAGDESAEAPTFPSGLTEFWDQYPKIGRQRSSRLKLLKPWTKWGCEKLLPEILGALEVYAESRSWQEGFVPGAHTWIANRKWTEAPAGNDDESLLRSM
jgi:hypothetical protein